MNFDQVITCAAKHKRTIAVAMADDEEVLSALAMAQQKEIAEMILIGDVFVIEKIAAKVNLDLKDVECILCTNPEHAAAIAVQCVREGKADILMKGILQTSQMLKAVLDKTSGLPRPRLLSHVTIVQTQRYDRLLFLTDAAMVPYPTLQQKQILIENAVMVTKSLGINIPKVAVVAPIELVNPDLPATIDAAILAQMWRRGQIKDCVVDGPLGLDNALDPVSAMHKGVQNSSVAGHADVLLVPNIDAGNLVYKTLGYMTSECITAGIIAGGDVPVVLTSRADSALSKLYSIACAVCYAHANTKALL